MLSRIFRRGCLYLGTVVATAMIAAFGAATAQASLCPIGNLCLFEPDGREVLVPAGQSKKFNPPLPVDEINNGTTERYCLTVRVSNGTIILTAIAAGQDERNLSESIISVHPGPVCPV